LRAAATPLGSQWVVARASVSFGSAFAGWGLFAAVVACGSAVFVTPSGDGGADASLGGAGGQSVSVGPSSVVSSSSARGAGGGGAASVPLSFCGGHVYACGDGIDNDGDGLVDDVDPECLGPCDNSEDSLNPSIPDTLLGCDRDCFWDAGDGHDEGCYFDHRCDPQADLALHPKANPKSYCSWNSADDGPVDDQIFPPSPYSCAEMQAWQAQSCLDACLPVTPNGCDCFGCCELAGTFVWLGTLADGGSCSLAAVGQPDFLELCRPCTPVPSCLNPCEGCELCVGQTTLPAGCSQPACAEGQLPCGTSPSDTCGQGSYCITGCCVPES
jgi:hypothetical protein